MKIGWQLTKLLQKITRLTFLAHPVLYLLIVERQKHVTNCRTKFFYNKTTNYCTFAVALSVQNVHH